MDLMAGLRTRTTNCRLSFQLIHTACRCLSCHITVPCARHLQPACPWAVPQGQSQAGSTCMRWRMHGTSARQAAGKHALLGTSDPCMHWPSMSPHLFSTFRSPMVAGLGGRRDELNHCAGKAGLCGQPQRKCRPRIPHFSFEVRTAQFAFCSAMHVQALLAAFASAHTSSRCSLKKRRWLGHARGPWSPQGC